MGSIPTRDRWKWIRLNMYDLPEGIGPSLGSALQKYHDSKKGKKAIDGIKALEEVKKVVKKFRTSKDVFEYYVQNNNEKKHDGLSDYFEQLADSIEARIKTLKRYEVLVSKLDTVKIDDVLDNSKLRPYLFAVCKTEYSEYDYHFMMEWKKQKFAAGKPRVVAAMAFLDKYVMSGDANIGNLNELKALRQREAELRAEEGRGETTLWNELFEQLGLAEAEIRRALRDDKFRKAIVSPEFKRAYARVIGGEKGLKEYDAAMAKEKAK